jgi:hypothetical protein
LLRREARVKPEGPAPNIAIFGRSLGDAMVLLKLRFLRC